MPAPTPLAAGSTASAAAINRLTQTCAFTRDVAVGDTIFVFATERHLVGAPVFSTFTDARGNTYTLEKQGGAGTAPGFFGRAPCTAAITSGDLVTITFITNNADEINMLLVVVPGLGTVDGTAPNFVSASSSTTHSRAVTATNAGVLVIGMDANSGGTAVGVSMSANGTLIDSNTSASGNRGLVAFYNKPGDTSAHTTSVLWTTAHVGSINAIAYMFTHRLDLGVATRTGSGQALGKAKARSLGVASRTPAAQSFGKAKTRALSPAARTGTAQTLGRSKTRALGAATRTAVAQVIDRAPLVGHIIALGAATRTGLAQALGRVKSLAVSPAARTSSAQAVGKAKRRDLPVATAAHSAMAVGKGKTRAVGIASRTSESEPLTAAKSRALGTATRTSNAQQLAKAKRLALEAAVVVHEASGIRVGKSWAVGPATRQATALPLVVVITFPEPGTITPAPSAQGSFIAPVLTPTVHIVASPGPAGLIVGAGG